MRRIANDGFQQRATVVRHQAAVPHYLLDEQMSFATAVERIVQRYILFTGLRRFACLVRAAGRS